MPYSTLLGSIKAIALIFALERTINQSYFDTKIVETLSKDNKSVTK
jgi:hypothetical protein